MFSALTLAMDMRTGSQDDVLAIQANQLGDPEARLNGEQKQRSVATPDPGGMVSRRQEGSISSRLRNSMGRRSWRLVGIARTRWHSSACAGSSKATY